MKNIRLTLGFILILLSNCSKLLVKPNTKNTPINCYNQLYQDLKNKYVFFDYKQINRDSINQIYAPQIDNNMNETDLFRVLSKMMATLKDGHTSLYTPVDTFKYIFYDGRPNNFNETFISNTYLIPNNFKTTETIKHSILDGNIGYLYYPSFKNDLTEKGMNEILKSFSETKGLIIDIRHNLGGSNDNIYRLMEHFVENTQLLGSYQSKASATAKDFTAPYKISIVPKGTLYTKPIVILTNRRVYSSANIFCGFMSQLKNVRLIGDLTGGGSGVPTSNQLPNGWLYRFSTSFVTLADGQQFENGILPTIAVTTGPAEEAMGKDAIIERALLELK